MRSVDLNKLLDKEFSRREFLGLSAVAVASIFGLSGLIKILTTHAATSTGSTEAESGTANGVTTLTDSSASGGQAIRFGSGSIGATRGAAPIGSAIYPVPTSGTIKFVSLSGSDSAAGTLVAPYATVAHAVTQAGNGTVVVRAGTYHESFSTSSSLGPVTVQNYPNETVWFDGSVVITTWAVSGSVWVHNGVPTKFYRHSSGVGWSLDANSKARAQFTTDPYADLSDQVFIDGVPLNQIADGATPASGQFSVNYTANTITIGSNPSGHEVRVSDLRNLCVQSSQVSWKGVGIHRYAPDYTGSVTSPFYCGGNSAGSVYENLVIEDNACSGLSGLTKYSIVVRNCTVQKNAYTGIGATLCDGIQILNNVVQNNNAGLFKPAPQAGNIKVTSVRGCTIDNNYVNNANGGNGIWIDSSSIQLVISNNYVTGNHKNCIQYEEADGGFLNNVQGRSTIAGNILNGGPSPGNYLEDGRVVRRGGES